MLKTSQELRYKKSDTEGGDLIRYRVGASCKADLAKTGFSKERHGRPRLREEDSEEPNKNVGFLVV